MPYFITSTIFFYSWHCHHHLAAQSISPRHRREPTPPPANHPLISICVPARNEEHNIGACIESLLAQDYPNLEIIVLDDRSTDSTPAILRILAAQNDRLKIIHGSDLPPGWAGKPHALYQAAKSAHGEWLCFVDADTFLEPEAISSCHAKQLKRRLIYSPS